MPLSEKPNQPSLRAFSITAVLESTIFTLQCDTAMKHNHRESKTEIVNLCVQHEDATMHRPFELAKRKQLIDKMKTTHGVSSKSDVFFFLPICRLGFVNSM